MEQAVATRLSRLVEPALLYLLGSGAAAHGYDLLGEVNQMGLTDAQVDAGAIYRALRQLEEEGAVVSTWDTSGPGPARRNYELTDLGRARLTAWVSVIERRTDALQQFVERTRKLLGDRNTD
ncbi:MAG: helix-turn-helix transcriptional regulator [Armatimonadota bacterium]|nr:helix-turn-helix transcriptional regulator [Armatimonadota bacterium]